MKKFEGILILSDMDGTLLYNTELSEKNRLAIEYFTENGGLFAVATGRAPEFIKKYPLKINAPVITVNGSVIYDLKTDKILRQYTLDERCLSAAEYIKKNTNVTRISVFSVMEDFISEPKKADFSSFDKPVNKFVFVFDTEEDAINAKNTLLDHYGDACFVERSWATGVELLPKTGGKGRCVEFLKEYTGAEKTIGVGDYENDYSLLKNSDIAIAPESALPEIKAIADYVCARCEDGAIADIIYNIIPNGGLLNACTD